MTTYQELRSLLMQNKHDHALQAVARIRFNMLESQLAKAVAGRKEAERKLHEARLDENDELNRLRAENRRLLGELDAMRRVLSSAAVTPAAPVMAVAKQAEAVVGGWSPAKRDYARRVVGGTASERLRNSRLVQSALRGEPMPEPPEPGTFDPTITEEEERGL